MSQGTYFVVARDEDTEEGLGTVEWVGLLEDRAIDLERTLEPSGYTFDLAEWTGASRPRLQLRVRYTHDECSPYLPTLERLELECAVKRFDDVFGMDES